VGVRTPPGRRVRRFEWQSLVDVPLRRVGLGSGVTRRCASGSASSDSTQSSRQIYELDDYEGVPAHVAIFLKRLYGVDKVDQYGRLLWKDETAEEEEWDGSHEGSDPSLFTYGEVLPQGTAALAKELDIMNATVVFEVGCGRGRLAAQLFQQYPHLKYVLGIEKSDFRFNKCLEAASKLHLTFLEPVDQKSEGEGPFIVRKAQGRALATTPERRTLEFRKGDVISLVHVAQAMAPDVVIFNVCHKPELINYFKPFFDALNPGTRIVTYEDLGNLWKTYIDANDQAYVRLSPGSRFYTTWERNDGHEFYLWQKIN